MPHQFDEWFADYLIHPWDDEKFEFSKESNLDQAEQMGRKLAGV